MSDEIGDTAEIIKGEIAIIDLFLEKPEGQLPRCFPLDNFDKFKVCLPLASEQKLIITEVENVNLSKLEKIAPDAVGHLKLTVGKADTLLLKAIFAEDLDGILDNSAGTLTKGFSFPKFLTIKDNKCN